MGSPVSVVVTNLVMKDVEERALESFSSPTFLKAPCWWHLHSPSQDSNCPIPGAPQRHWTIHLVHSRRGEGWTAGFLDVLLHREYDGTISSSVYRKATHTNQYLSYMSYHPSAHKVRLSELWWQEQTTSGVEQTEKEKHVTDRQWHLLASFRSTPLAAEGERKWRSRDQRQPFHYPTLVGCLRQSNVS